MTLTMTRKPSNLERVQGNSLKLDNSHFHIQVTVLNLLLFFFLNISFKLHDIRFGFWCIWFTKPADFAWLSDSSGAVCSVSMKLIKSLMWQILNHTFVLLLYCSQDVEFSSLDSVISFFCHLSPVWKLVSRCTTVFNILNVMSSLCPVLFINLELVKYTI